jgi:hypothetical protein
MRSYAAILEARNAAAWTKGETPRAHAMPTSEEVGQECRAADPWSSAESLDAERRFGQPHARLFPFIGHKVRTPEGPGTLIQVFAERVTVLLDCEVTRCAWFDPREVCPVVSE